MQIRLIIFDLDGTLVDTIGDIRASLNYALGSAGIKPLSANEVRAMVGGGIGSLISRALGEADAQHHEEVLSAFLAHYRANLVVETSIYGGVEETLEKLGEFELAVISNKNEALSRGVLEQLGLLGHFKLVLGGDSTSEKKPSAEPVLKVLRELGFKPEEALMVGDSPTDIEAAHAAGLRCVALTSGYRKAEVLGKAEVLISHMTELIPTLIKLKAIEEKRRKPRTGVPELYRKHIKLRVRGGAEEFKAQLLDISEQGILFKFADGQLSRAHIECALTMPRSLTHVVVFRARVVHTEQIEDATIAGAEIVDVADGVWFKIFMQILQFIKDGEAS